MRSVLCKIKLVVLFVAQKDFQKQELLIQLKIKLSRSYNPSFKSYS